MVRCAQFARNPIARNPTGPRQAIALASAFEAIG